MTIVGKWNLNGNANASIGVNLTPTSISWVDGKNNGAGSFNGTTSKRTVGVNYYGNGNIHKTTVKFKVNSLPTSGNAEVLTCNVVDFGTSGSIYLINSGGTQQIRSTNYYTTGNINLVINYTLNIGQYYILTRTTDGTGMKLYLDGVLIGSNSNTGIFRTTANIFRIGAQPQGRGSSFFDGVIDDVAIDNNVGGAALIKNDNLLYKGYF